MLSVQTRRAIVARIASSVGRDRASRLTAVIARVEAMKFRKDQLRDDHGRWTDDPSSGGRDSISKIAKIAKLGGGGGGGGISSKSLDGPDRTLLRQVAGDYEFKHKDQATSRSALNKLKNNDSAPFTSAEHNYLKSALNDFIDNADQEDDVDSVRKLRDKIGGGGHGDYNPENGPAYAGPTKIAKHDPNYNPENGGVSAPYVAPKIAKHDPNYDPENGGVTKHPGPVDLKNHHTPAAQYDALVSHSASSQADALRKMSDKDVQNLDGAYRYKPKSSTKFDDSDLKKVLDAEMSRRGLPPLKQRKINVRKTV